MNKTTYLAGAAFAAAVIATPASAATTISGQASSVSAHSSGNGLLIDYSTPSFSTTPLVNAGDSSVVTVLQLGTPEGSVEPYIFGSPEDNVPKAISVTFSFTDPTGVFGGGPVSGTTTGFYDWSLGGLFGPCGGLGGQGGCGYVNWSDTPVEFSFGNGGKFSLLLQDAVFATDGDQHWGDAFVQGTFTLLSNSVPEPSTWMMLILGFGAIGAAMRRNQRQTVRYSFA